MKLLQIFAGAVRDPVLTPPKSPALPELNDPQQQLVAELGSWAAVRVDIVEKLVQMLRDELDPVIAHIRAILHRPLADWDAAERRLLVNIHLLGEKGHDLDRDLIVLIHGTAKRFYELLPGDSQRDSLGYLISDATSNFLNWSASGSWPVLSRHDVELGLEAAHLDCPSRGLTWKLQSMAFVLIRCNNADCYIESALDLYGQGGLNYDSSLGIIVPELSARTLAKLLTELWELPETSLELESEREEALLDLFAHRIRDILPQVLLRLVPGQVFSVGTAQVERALILLAEGAEFLDAEWPNSVTERQIVADRVVPLLRGFDSEIIRQACRVLGAVAYDWRHVKAIVPILDHPEADVKSAAAEAIREILALAQEPKQPN